MNNWLKKLKVKAILPAAALLAAAAIGTTFAWRNWDVGLTNNLKAHSTGVDVKEEFNPNASSDNKKVWFQNTGSSSVLLRVSYTETWEKGGYLLSNKKENGEEAAKKVWTDAWRELWLDGGDGWYYYKKVLNPNGTTAPILTHVAFDNLPAEYDGADYSLYFKAEVIQYSDGNNTLNSEELNQTVSRELFGKTASITSQKGEIIVNWD